MLTDGVEWSHVALAFCGVKLLMHQKGFLDAFQKKEYWFIDV